VSAPAQPPETPPPEPAGSGLTKRRWGYVVWAVALGFVFIPEILAALPLTESQLPFPTISRMTGHLEYEHAEWEIATTMLIVFVLLSLLRVPPKESGQHTPESIAARREDGDVRPHRSPGGRLTVAPTTMTAEQFDDEEVSRDVWFAVRSVGAALAIVGITLLALRHWPNQYVGTGDSRRKVPNYHVAYFLYGSIGFFWLFLPSLTTFTAGKDAEFPSLFRTVINLEQWLAGHRKNPWAERIGKAAAWSLSFLLVWGMVFLMLHLTFYPFPNITHILNHHG
jgi:hypothetical protein